VFVESKSLYFRREPAPASPAPLAIGRSHHVREGGDVTIVALSRMVGEALEAADRLAREGIEADVFDPRTLVPLDLEPIAASLRRTGRAVVAHEAVRAGGFGAELAAQLQAAAFDYLEAPIQRVGAPFMPVPLSPSLEDAYRVGSEEIHRAALAAMRWEGVEAQTPAVDVWGLG
jgi:pyruvate dehydrogenase E1 component beta subunit